MNVQLQKAILQGFSMGFALLISSSIFFFSSPLMAASSRVNKVNDYSEEVVEIIRLNVPADLRRQWLEAEAKSWGNWLELQSGFLGRQLFWDREREEATLLIHWASRNQWKSIPTKEIELIQERFENFSRNAIGKSNGNPFPLVYEGEMIPQ